MPFQLKHASSFLDTFLGSTLFVTFAFLNRVPPLGILYEPTLVGEEEDQHIETMQGAEQMIKFFMDCHEELNHDE